MDPRTAAHVLGQIAAHLELRGESSFKSRAYEQAATALLAIDTDDLAPMYRSGELARTRGFGPATLSVVRDLIESGESSYLEQLRATTPPGLLELLRVPGLGTAKIHKLQKMMESFEVVDPSARPPTNRVFFGATVTVANAQGEERTVSIVGVDEIDTARGYISWVSPMARALLKAREGDTVVLRTPGGVEELEIVAVKYVPLATGEGAPPRNG